MLGVLVAHSTDTRPEFLLVTISDGDSGLCKGVRGSIPLVSTTLASTNSLIC